MSQRADILHMLRVAPGRTVSSEQFLAAGIPRYSARIWELRNEGHRISMSPQKGRKTVVFRLEFDCMRDVERSGSDRSPDGPTSSAPAALSVTDGVEGSRSIARRRAAAPLSAKPLSPYEYDLLDAA